MTISDNMRGIWLMCASMLAFTLNDTFVKAVIGDGMPLSQAIVLRGLVATLGLLVIASRSPGGLHLLPQGPDRRYLTLRTLGEVTATVTFLVALTHMPLANLSAIMQFLPLAVTLAAAVLLKTPIGWLRLAAILVGFGGVMLIIRPGAADFDLWSVLGLASVACVVLRDLSTRFFSPNLPSTTGALWASVAVTVMGGVGVIGQGWHPLSLQALAETTAAAGFLIVGYLAAIKVMRVGDLAVVAPFRYTSLLFAILLGWARFGTLPDHLTLIGGAIVVASGVYMLMRERRR
ncbi:MAG: DMT family transporter [Pseudomonadota bacterium]